MGQCGITSSKTVLVFLNLIFWVSPGAAGDGEGRGLRARGCLPLSRAVRGGLGPGSVVAPRPGPEGAAGPGRAVSSLSGPRSRTVAAGSLPPPRRFSLYLKAFCLTVALCPFAGPRVSAAGAVPSFPTTPHKFGGG